MISIISFYKLETSSVLAVIGVFPKQIAIRAQISEQIWPPESQTVAETAQDLDVFVPSVLSLVWSYDTSLSHCQQQAAGVTVLPFGQIHALSLITSIEAAIPGEIK